MTTTMNGDNCVSLMKGTLVRPVPRYPASIVTDESLKVAANQVEATLRGNIGAGDTILTLGDASQIVPNMLLTIDNEIVSVSSVIDANHVSVVRGFDGTVATSHSNGRTLRANIDAWHHNALAAEVEAIEQALGPNLSNVSGSGGSALTLASRYVWARSPGGSLAGGSVNTVTLTPVPLGVNGTDKGHWLYVSGGTGAAEPVLIVGGTAVAGAPSGTILFTPVNSHTGSWSIATATSGAQEALQASCYTPATQGIVYYGPGAINNYAPVVLNANRVGISGSGIHVSMVVQNTPNTDFIQVGDNVTAISGLAVSDMTLTPNFAGANTSGYGVNVRYVTLVRVDNIRVYGANLIWRGINVVDTIHGEVARCRVEQTVDQAIRVTGTAGRGNTDTRIWQTTIHISGSDGVYIGDYANANYVYDSEIYGMHNGYAVNLASTTGSYAHFIRGNDISAAAADGSIDAGGIRIAAGVTEAEISDNQIMGGTAVRPCILIEGGIVRVVGCTIKQNSDRAAIENKNAVHVVGTLFNGSNLTTSAIQAMSTSVFTNITGCGFYQYQGVPIRIDNAATNITITGNSFLASPGGWLGTPASLVATANFGVDNVVPLVASAATITIDDSSTIQISGTTTILNINGGWEGRTIHLIKPNAGDVTVGSSGGGNVVGVRVLTNFIGHIDLVYIQGQWY